MSLPMPRLDTRTFDQLVEEARALIPRYSPEWTDHNYSDPGITLLDLFAWLTEADSYRLDRTPEASYRAFLRMAGVDLRAASAAEAVLVVGREAAGAAIRLPAGIQATDKAGTVVFQTVEALNVSAAKLVAVLSGPDGALVDRSREIETPGKPYAPLGPQPRPGDALYLGFDLPFGDEAAVVSMYLWTASPEKDRETRARLLSEWKDARAEADRTCPGDAGEPIDWSLHYSARTTWEYYAHPAGPAPGAGARPDEWVTLPGVVDLTRGLTMTGAIRFTAPPASAQARGGVQAAPHAQRYFVRCRLTAGAYDCTPEIRAVALNAVTARHAADIDAQELVGTSNGTAGQVFHTRRSPVVAGTTRLEVRHDSVEEGKWREEPNWDRVGPHERCYVLSPGSGEIAFGNGRRGRVPPAGADIRVSYRVGGGTDGNVPAETLIVLADCARNAALLPAWNALRPVLRVAQPYPAIGGAAAESLNEGKARALALVTDPRRAITLADIENLSLATPGVPVARARALADYDPALPCLPALGSTTVIVVPDCPGQRRPRPGPGMLDAIRRHLDRRRPVTTELHVIAPLYVTVSVRARLHLRPHVDAARLRTQAMAALDRFLDPLRGGPDGAGWPIGRPVYRAEVMALLNDLPGVACVDEVVLHAARDTGQAEDVVATQAQGGDARCGNIDICAHGLVAPGEHAIAIAGDEQPRVPPSRNCPQAAEARPGNRERSGSRGGRCCG